ncbi:hypothetical protein C9374_000604 [Naegleria lovaniensis]|uniref:Uncharacterized protein n=1 Tax=Naegleria lovaniensis TaxID=51637 RepID=A0AA88GWT2_NAELO|nr:uncharacterized protein C9374_000604 [Naegleria lovaniensis]KAG2388440.1 hypothetical protein C9374_000604 [Naegleria lovaniensis]
MRTSSESNLTMKPNPKGFDAFIKRSVSPNIQNFKRTLTMDPSEQRHKQHSNPLLSHSFSAEEPSTLLQQSSAVSHLNADIRYEKTHHELQQYHHSPLLPPLAQGSNLSSSPKINVVPPFKAFPFSSAPSNNVGDMDFPIPQLSAENAGELYYKPFKTLDRGLRDPVSWDESETKLSELIPNKPSVVKKMSEVFISKFDKPVQQFIKESFSNQSCSLVEKNNKDHKVFRSEPNLTPNATTDFEKVQLLKREHYRNGKPRKAEIVTLEKKELRKALKIHGDSSTIYNEEGEFHKQLGPRQMRALVKAEAEREEFLKLERDIRRKKNKFIRIINSGYRHGVLNVQDDMDIFDKDGISTSDIMNRSTKSEGSFRRERLRKMANSELGRMTLRPDEFSEPFSQPFMQRKAKTELSEKMQKSNVVIALKEQDAQNSKQFIFNNQTRNDNIGSEIDAIR